MITIKITTPLVQLCIQETEVSTNLTVISTLIKQAENAAIELHEQIDMYNIETALNEMESDYNDEQD